MEEAKGCGRMTSCNMGGEGEHAKATFGWAANKEKGWDEGTDGGGNGGVERVKGIRRREIREFGMVEEGGEGVGGGEEGSAQWPMIEWEGGRGG